MSQGTDEQTLKQARKLIGQRGPDRGSHPCCPIEMPIKTREKLRAARHIFEGNRFQVHDDLSERVRERIARVAEWRIATVGMGISPVMNLIQHWLGPNQTYWEG